MGVIVVIFFLFNIMPSDPAKMMLGDRDDDRQIELINEKYHFNKPTYEQFAYYLNDLSPISFHFKTPIYDSYWSLIKKDNFSLILKMPYLRTSFYQKNMLVSDLILNSLSNTIVLAFSAILFALFFGIPLGILAAVFKDRFLDKFLSFFSVLGMSLPSFFSSVLMAYFFAYKFGEITHLNITGSLFVVDDLGVGERLCIKNLILPALTLGIRPLAVIVHLTRAALIDELQADYVFLAKSKGLTLTHIILVHALRNSMSSIVTTASGWFAGMLSGAVFVEYIFGWNGLGKLLVDALISVDFPVVMGVILIIASFFILINILVDLIYIWLDPRVEIN